MKKLHLYSILVVLLLAVSPMQLYANDELEPVKTPTE